MADAPGPTKTADEAQPQPPAATAHRTSNQTSKEMTPEEKKEEKEKHILADQQSDVLKEYTRLRNRFERALIEHKLAADYYEFRSFYFNFLPLTIIATATTIIGFLISGSAKYPADVGDENGGLQDIQFDPLLTTSAKTKWAIAVGILGAISTLLTTLGKYLNYQSQCDMHQAAVKALEKICLQVDFEKDWFNRKATSDDFINAAVRKRMAIRKESKDADMPDDMERIAADLKSHQASFKAMQDACGDSPVPTRVVQVFTVLDQIVRTPTDSLYFYHKLWKEYSTYEAWPLKAPTLNVVKKYDDWKLELAQLNVVKPPAGNATPDTNTTQTTPTIGGGYQSIDHQGDANTQDDRCCFIL